MHALEASSTYQWLLDRGRREGREEGLEQGREQGLEQGREQGLEQGREQGLEQGREQGLEQGERQAKRAMIVDLGKLRLGPPPQDVLDRLNAIDDTRLLQALVLKSTTATSWDQLTG